MKPATLILLLVLPVLTLAGDAPSPGPNSPTVAPGTRYQLLSAPVTAAGETADLQLQVILRLDTHTGRTWRLSAQSGPARDTNTLSWIPIGEPSEPAPNPTQYQKTPTNPPPPRDAPSKKPSVSA